MKTLYLIRHAKSSWKDITLADFDRPLNKRGKKNAPFMGKLLKQKGVKPDIIISSPAKRAKDTANIIAEIIGYNKEIVFEPKIYESNLISLKNIIYSIDDTNKVAFLFGHNPCLNIFVEDFCAFYENIPTCGIVMLEFSCESWEDIAIDNCNLALFDYPKKYTKG